VKVLNDTTLLVEDLPTLAGPLQQLGKLEIFLNLTLSPRPGGLDVLLVDQPQVRSLSPQFVIENDGPFRLLVNVHSDLFPMV
jgi:hypothetical protein